MQPTLTPPANAFWVGSDHPFDLHEVYLCFRSPGQWRLAQPPARAKLFITADSRYKLWVAVSPEQGDCTRWVLDCQNHPIL